MFKIAGLIAGMYIAKLTGAVVGLLVGVFLDIVLDQQLRKLEWRRHFKRKAQNEAAKMFYESCFSMLAKLVAVDGGPTKSEIDLVRSLMKDVMKLKRRQRKHAETVLATALRTDTTFAFHAAQFYELYKVQPQMLEGMINIMFQVAISDSVLKPAEERLIRTAAEIFGLPVLIYKQIRAKYVAESERGQENNRGADQRNTRTAESSSTSEQERVLTPLERSYAVLGCTVGDSADTLRSRYRKLIQDFHPDKIHSKELPEEFVIFATQRFREIQSAWETVKKARGL